MFATRKPSKPCAKKVDVLLAIRDLVSQNQPIERTDLESLVKHKLRDEQNFSLSGAKLRIQECLSSDEFLIDESGLVCLRQRPDDEASTTRRDAAVVTQ